MIQGNYKEKCVSPACSQRETFVGARSPAHRGLSPTYTFQILSLKWAQTLGGALCFVIAFCLPLNAQDTAILASQIYLPAEKPIETNQKDLSATLPNIAETRSVIREIAGDDCVAFLGFTPIVDILDSPIPLAALTPQEHILITSGMLEIVNTRSEFAFLMAHEIAHYLLGHLRTSEASVNSHWSLSQEASADALALKLLGNTTFHHSAAISLLQRLEAFGEESGTALRDLYPTLSQRRTTLLSAVSNIS